MPLTLPRFQTERLTLTQRAMADLEDCLAMDRDPAVTRFIAGPWHDPVEHRAFVIDRITRAYPPGMGYWTIRTRAESRFIGWILLTPLDLVGPEVEIGWRVISAERGQGYAAEAGRPVLVHALGPLALPEVVADIDPVNHASLRVAVKLGMTPGPTVRYAGRPVRRYAIRSVAPPGAG
jgi:RimJ/RimL family protein N-acetyltransferase